MNMSERVTLSPVRKFMLWAFGDPSNDPYVNVNLDLEFEQALAFLEKKNQETATKISIHVLLIKALADAFHEHPRLNVKIFSNEIYKLPSINIATPINLVKKGWKPNNSELGVAIIRDADKKRLEEIAKEITGGVQEYQKGGSTLLIEEIAKFLYRYLPDFSLRLLFKSVSLLSHNRILHDLVHEFMGISTIFTNLGSILRPCPGVHYKSGGLTIPDRIVHFGTCFGAGPIEKKVFVENDQPVIKSVIPIMIIFDHRIIDGFLISHFIEDFAKRIQNPEKYYSPSNTPQNVPSEQQK